MSLLDDYNKIANDKKKQSNCLIAQWLLNNEEIDKSILEKENKNLDECMQYIIKQASGQKNGNCAVVDDSTVFGWARTYYEDDSIKMKNDTPKAVVNASTPTPSSYVRKNFPQLQVEKDSIHYIGDEFKIITNDDLQGSVVATCDKDGVIFINGNNATCVGIGKAVISVYTNETDAYYRSSEVKIKITVKDTEQLSLF